MSFKSPHVQDQDPEQFLSDPQLADLYKDVIIPPPAKSAARFFHQFPLSVQVSENRRRWAARFSSPEMYQRSVKNYYRLITGVDNVVGRIVSYLDSAGLADNTIIVFTSDNGFYLGERGLAGKWMMHEESIRTPLIVADPRLRASHGKRREAMTLNIDMAPTMLEMAGLTPAPHLQGRSVIPLLDGNPAWRSDWFYEHHFGYNGWIPRTEGIRSRRWKYTRYLDSDPLFEELFDLRNDPEELNNLAAASQHRPQLTTMRERWQSWRGQLDSTSETTAWRDPS
jgi:arylsulfatase A-like enzyme